VGLKRSQRLNAYLLFILADAAVAAPVLFALCGMSCMITLMCTHMMHTGLSIQEHDDLQDKFGPNALDIDVPSYWTLLWVELFSPFLVFQMFSITLWILEAYYLFAMGILGFAFVTLGMNLLETRRNLAEIARMARIQCKIKVRRAGAAKFTLIDAAELVPGDIIQVEDHLALPCDAVLLHGTCVMNESMLTGESVPVMKTPVDLPVVAANDAFGTVLSCAHLYYVCFQ